MPESQTEVSASSTSHMANVVQVAQPSNPTPVNAPAPTTEKVWSPETDNQFSSAEIEALINKAKAPKPEVVETPKEPVLDNVQKGTLTETPKTEVKEVVGGEEKKGVQEVKPTEDIRSVVASVIEEKFKDLGVKPDTEKVEDKFFGFKDQVELDSAYASDPAGTTKKVLEAQFSDMIKKSIAEQIEPFKQQIAPVTEKLQNEQINSHMTEAKEKVPELKDANSPMSQDFKKFLADKDNHVLINEWSKKGKNPLLEVAKLVRAERLSEYIASAKQQGIQEGEDKALKASRAVVEGGGKQAIEENMTMEKFNSMSSAEMEKYLISKGAIRR